MKTAEQMFEELGYVKEDIDYYIVYFERRNPQNYIIFRHQKVEFPTENGLGYKIINSRLMKAIYMQMEELEWIENA